MLKSVSVAVLETVNPPDAKLFFLSQLLPKSTVAVYAALELNSGFARCSAAQKLLYPLQVFDLPKMRDARR